MTSAGTAWAYHLEPREAALSFWDEHNERESELQAAARLPQNAPMECAFCGHFGDDVMLAVCAACTPPTRSGCTT